MWRSSVWPKAGKRSSWEDVPAGVVFQRLGVESEMFSMRECLYGGIFLGAMLSLGCGSPTTAPSTTSTLAGQVYSTILRSTLPWSSDRYGIPAATVSIVDGPDGGKSTTTDGAGNYKFTGLQQSTFTVRQTSF